MNQVCLAVPVLPGNNPDATDSMREPERARKLGGRRSKQPTGIVTEASHLARAPLGLSRCSPSPVSAWSVSRL